jgi:ELWxxDGT repeat protein
MALSYFVEDISGVQQLWVTDGTVAGTHLVSALATRGSLISRRSAAAHSSP